MITVLQRTNSQTANTIGWNSNSFAASLQQQEGNPASAPRRDHPSATQQQVLPEDYAKIIRNALEPYNFKITAADLTYDRFSTLSDSSQLYLGLKYYNPKLTSFVRPDLETHEYKAYTVDDGIAKLAERLGLPLSDVSAAVTIGILTEKILSRNGIYSVPRQSNVPQLVTMQAFPKYAFMEGLSSTLLLGMQDKEGKPVLSPDQEFAAAIMTAAIFDVLETLDSIDRDTLEKINNPKNGVSRNVTGQSYAFLQLRKHFLADKPEDELTPENIRSSVSGKSYKEFLQILAAGSKYKLRPEAVEEELFFHYKRYFNALVKPLSAAAIETGSPPLMMLSKPIMPGTTATSASQLPRENKRNIILNILNRFKQLIVPRKSQ